MKRYTATACLLMISGCLSYNLAVSWKYFSKQRLGDPAGYSLLAKQSRWFYDSGTREPVPVFLTGLYSGIGFNDDTSARVSGMAITAGMTLLLFFAGSSVFTPAAGAISALIYASNPYVGFYSVHGASQIILGFFLAVLFFLLCRTPRSMKITLSAGVTAGLACLTRLETLAVIPLILPADVFLKKGGLTRRLKTNGLILAVCLIVTAPYPVYQYAKFGHPFYTHTVHAKFWDNTYEGLPIERRYEGGTENIASFLAKGGIAAGIKRFALGYIQAFTKYYPKIIFYFPLFILFLLGIAASLLRKKYFMPLYLAALIFPIAPILTMDQQYPGSGAEFRFLMHTFWLASLFCGIGAEEIMKTVDGRWKMVNGKRRRGK